MRAKWPAIRKRTNASGTESWCVDPGMVLGKRERFFFKTKVEAEAKANLLRIMKGNHGAVGLGMSDRLRMEAMECAARLEPLGVSLTAAVDYYLQHARPSGGERTVAEIRDEFLAAKLRADRRPEYLRVQRHILGKFCEAFGPRKAHEIATGEIEDWMSAQPWSLRTRRNYFNDLRNFFGYAVRKGYGGSNPVLRIEKPSVDETKPGILTPAQAAALLAAAENDGGRTTAFFAIGMFAGLRTAELLKLDWSHVDLGEGTIEVPSDISKTRQSRYVPMSDNLRAWLQPLARAEGPVRPPSAWRYHIQRVRTAAGITEWPDNALRHSFGSFHFAQHNNAALTAAMLGHHSDTRTLFAHYRALVKPKDAALFWSISPSVATGKIVQMAPAA